MAVRLHSFMKSTTCRDAQTYHYLNPTIAGLANDD